MADFSLTDLSPYAEGGFLSELAQDWAQTRQTARDPKHKQEANPILGPHPSQAQVNAYMALMGLAHYGTYKAIPDDEAKLTFVLLSDLIEGNAVSNNRKLGEKINSGALGLGTLATAYLVNEWNKDHKQKLSPYVSSVGKTPTIGLTYQW